MQAVVIGRAQGMWSMAQKRTSLITRTPPEVSSGNFSATWFPMRTRRANRRSRSSFTTCIAWVLRGMKTVSNRLAFTQVRAAGTLAARNIAEMPSTASVLPPAADVAFSPACGLENEGGVTNQSTCARFSRMHIRLGWKPIRTFCAVSKLVAHWDGRYEIGGKPRAQIVLGDDRVAGHVHPVAVAPVRSQRKGELLQEDIYPRRLRCSTNRISDVACTG
jgi:hypothetical protein